MNPALPKTVHIRIEGEAKRVKEMQNSCEERKSGVNPALPKTVHIRIEGEAKKFKEMQNSLANLNVGLGIAKKGRAG